MIAEKPIASPGKWHGAKGAFNGKLAKWLVGLMPPHLHYVEPYFGMGSVMLAKNPNGVSEVANDIHRGLTNFWRVLADDIGFEAFKRRIEATPFSEIEWKEARECRLDNVGWAVDFFIRCRQSLAGRCDSFAPLTRNRIRGGMNEQASAWLSAVEGLPVVHERMKRVVITGRDALSVIQQQDGLETLFYLDPPYLRCTRTAKDVYDHEMSAEDHTALLETLCCIKGQFVLSGYRSELYDAWATTHSFSRYDFATVNNAASGSKKRKMVECAWTNFEPVSRG